MIKNSNKQEILKHYNSECWRCGITAEELLADDWTPEEIEDNARSTNAGDWIHAEWCRE